MRALSRAGFYIDHHAGSHAQLRHPTRTGRVTVPIHSGDLPVFILISIIRQAGLTRDEFVELLEA